MITVKNDKFAKEIENLRYKIRTHVYLPDHDKDMLHSLNMIETLFYQLAEYCAWNIAEDPSMNGYSDKLLYDFFNSKMSDIEGKE